MSKTDRILRRLEQEDARRARLLREALTSPEQQARFKEMDLLIEDRRRRFRESREPWVATNVLVDEYLFDLISVYENWRQNEKQAASRTEVLGTDE